MQSTEMKPQNGTVGIGETSREGYMELNRIHMEEKGKMRHLYEKDLVSTLSELRYYCCCSLGLSQTYSHTLSQI